MSTHVVTLDELNVESALGLDPFGSVFRGIERSSGREVIILGISPPAQQKITGIKLQQSLRGPLNVTHKSIAPIIAHGLLDDERARALHDLITLTPTDTSEYEASLPRAYIAYHVSGGVPVRDVIEHLDEAARVKIMRDLLEALNSLHDQRVTHLGISPHALWWTDGGLILTHSGASSLMKKGLSLSRDQSGPDPHIVARLPYTSPEEIAGKLTHQSCDLYSTSVIMHEFLIGPLVSPDLDVDAVITRINNGLASSVSEQLSAPWQALFRRGLGQTVRERFTSVNRLLKTIDDCMKHPLRVSFDDPSPVQQPASALNDTHEHGEDDQELDGTINEQSPLLNEADQEADKHFQDEFNASTMENDLGVITEALQEFDRTEEVSAGDLGVTAQTDLVSHRVSPQEGTSSGDEAIFETVPDMTPITDHISTLGEPTLREGDHQTAEDRSPDETEVSTPAEHQDQGDVVNATHETLDTPTAEEDQRTAEIEIHQRPEVAVSPEEEPQSEPVEAAVQSLRSKMSQKQSPSSSSSTPTQELSTPSDDIGDMAFGIPESDMAFGFSQDDVGERTFLEYSDIDEQTLFEEDLDAAVKASHKTMMGLPAAQSPEPKPRTTPPPGTPPSRTAIGMPYQSVPELSGSDLQSPDFLSDFEVNSDPSRVLPIPNSSQTASGAQGPQPISIPNASLPAKNEAIPLPVDATPAGYAPTYTADPSLFPQSGGDAPVKPVHQSSLVATAQDWPTHEAENYTPPSQDIRATRGRQAPRLQEQRSLTSKIASWLLLIVVIVSGGIGIYWASSHWDQIAVMLSVESAESINISTTPSSMSVRIDQNSPLSTPAIFKYEGQHAVGDELQLKFMWKPDKSKRSRKRRRRRKRRARPNLVDIKTQVLSGNSNLYFIGGAPGETYAQSLLLSHAESLQVTLQDPSLGPTPLGQTPLIIIGPKNRALTLQLQGASIKGERTITLGQPQDAQVVIESDTEPSP